MTTPRLAAALAAAAWPLALRSRRQQELSCEDRALPAWLAPGGMPSATPFKDLSRQAKIEAYEAVQTSEAAKARNSALPQNPGRADPRRLRLASFNIHFHRDCRFDPNLSRVFEALASIDADVVALQEAGLPRGLEKSGGIPPKEDVDEATVQSTDSVEELTKGLWASMELSVVPADGQAHNGQELLEGMRRLGYNHCVYSPGFPNSFGGHCGNAVFSRRPFVAHESTGTDVVILDKNRFREDRSAAVGMVALGSVSLAVASVHLDVWAEMRGHFGMAEGEAIRLLELEALHEAVKDRPNVMILGDFNTPSRLSAKCSSEHGRMAELIDRLSAARDPQALRHFLPRSSPRLPETMTALGFVEQTLGYRHCWQELPVPMAPWYSHWSGQLIDHCLLRSQAKLRVIYAGVFHTAASDHLPLIVDVEVCD